MLEFLWGTAVLYVIVASFALAENLSCERTLMRGWRAKARIAVEAFAWPAEESWLRLRQFVSEQWQNAVPRYQGMP
jgi:hypothetical protein